MRYLYAALLAGSFALSVPAQDSKDEAKATNLKVGDKAPVLKADKWLQNPEVKVFESGRIYVVEFWATWCGPCIVMMPHLAELQEHFKDKVTVIGYTAKDPNNTAEKVAEFVEKRGPKLRYTFAFADTREGYNAWMQAAGQNGIPCTFVVDGTGKIAYIGHPMFLDLVLPKVVDGTWKINEGTEALKEAEAAVDAVFAALDGAPEKSLKALASFEAKYPELKEIPYFVGPKLTGLLKAEKFAEAKKYAADKIARAIRADNTSMLGQMVTALTSANAAGNKELAGLALEAATANAKVVGDADAVGAMFLAKALNAVGEKAKAMAMAEKAVENASQDSRKKAIRTSLKDILDGEAAGSEVAPSKIAPPTPPAGEPIAVKLAPGDLKGPFAPKFAVASPLIPLKTVESGLPGFDHLSATLHLGPQKDAKTPLILARTIKDGPYDTLYIDSTGSGKVGDAPIRAKGTEVQGRITFQFEVELKVDYAKTSLRSAVQAYPATLSVIGDKAGSAPTGLELSPRGYMSGRVTIEGKTYTVVLVDANADGTYGSGDRWELCADAEKAGNENSFRVVGDFQWAGERAFKFNVMSANGKSGVLTEVKPGIARAEDEAKRAKETSKGK